MGIVSVKNAYIKFHTAEDSLAGCHELVTHSHFSRLSNDVFCVQWADLALLDTREIQYSFASEDDLANAKQIWNFAAPKTR